MRGPAAELVAHDVVTRWSLRLARCRRCGAVYEAASCPMCGEWPGGVPIEMVGVLETAVGGSARLRLVEDFGGRQILHRTRLLTAEQLRWLQRATGDAAAGGVG